MHRILSLNLELTDFEKRLADHFSIDAEHGELDLSHYTALSLNVSAVGASGIEGHEAIHAARRLGIPLILEAAEDPSVMRKLVGIGIPSQIALIRFVTDNHSVINTYVSDAESQSRHIDAAATQLASLADSAWELPALVEKQNSKSTSMATSAAVSNSDLQQISHTWQWNCGATKTISYPFHNNNYPGGSQVVNIDTIYNIELWASQDTDASGVYPYKYLYVYQTGAGAYPGSLIGDDKNTQGFYQEHLQFNMYWADMQNAANSMPSLASNFAVYDYNPKVTNSTSSATSSVSFNVGVSASRGGPGADAGLTVGNSYTYNLSDFEVGVAPYQIGITCGMHWDYAMCSVEGHPYSEWEDLVNNQVVDKDLYSVPELAKSSYTTNSQIVLQAPNTYEGIANVVLDFTGVYQYVGIDAVGLKDTPFHFEQTFTYSHWDETGQNMQIDFGIVSPI
ncbi:hypothetical protein [Arenicella xantha]|uniref:Uncharacterized protein n=1 Tax=Arenicella xantha TaxID=644221 RepID=A0A395JQW8_9GAMM|nr:hypothetical protein [Arenicella xantha]RBP51110.1 hypothetical protein DFR28_102529 [Arenicella xantha]